MGESARRVPWAALALALCVAGVHAWIRANAPRPRLWGDEPGYALLAREEARAGRTSLLPGTLGFEHRPLFGARVAALFAPEVFAGVTRLNIVLLALTVLLTYAQARVLGLGLPGSLGAAALLGSFPWLGFHVHSLWPEVLHAFFFAVLLLALLAHLRAPRLPWLILAGVATAYALLTKAALAPFVPLFALLPALAAGRDARGAGPARRVRAALLPAAVYALTVLLVLLPQLLVNARRGHGWSLAANRWWNLELGLASDTTQDEVNRTYVESAPDYGERERLARERTLAAVRELGPGRILVQQVRKLSALLFQKRSELEASLERESRWGDPPPRWLAELAAPARVEWYALLLLGGIGMVLTGTKDRAWLLLLLFALGYLAALLLVPLKPRFVLPLVPVLCLFSAACLETLARRIPAARRRESAAGAAAPVPPEPPAPTPARAGARE